MNTMTAKGTVVLGSYASDGDRELCWNYLAQLQRR